MFQRKLKDKPWHVEGSDNAEWVLMDYVNVVVHFPNTNTRILQYRDLWGDKITAISKQILKRKKRRMAKDNNPTPNKFKVSHG
jgi:excinuclease UvrABC nuclease subunit